MIIAICDDEKILRNNIKKVCQDYLSRRKYEVEIVEFSTGEELLQNINNIDVLLLDIELEGINGIQIKKILDEKRKDIKIIFITSHIELMEEAFGRNVYSFLVKPLNQEKFEYIMDKIMHEIEAEFVVQLDNKELPFVKSNRIIYLRAADKYTILKIRDNEYLVRRSLNEWEKILVNHNFYRIHKSFIINMVYVRRIFDTGIIMDNGDEVKVSRSILKKFKESYYDYIRNKVIGL